MDPIRGNSQVVALNLALLLGEMLDPANYAFSLYAVPPLLIGILTFVLGWAVLIRERGSLVSWAFFLMSVAGGLWLTSYTGIYCARPQAVALLWVKIENVAVAFIPSLVYFFALTVSQRLRRMRWSLVAALAVSAIYAAIIFTTPYFVSGLHRYPWGWYARYGGLSSLFIAGFTALMLMSLYLLWKEYATARSTTAKRRFKLLCLGFGIAFLGSVDYLPAYGVWVYPVGYLPVLFFLLIAATAVWKYRLVDITPSLAAQQMISTMTDAVIVVDCEGIVRVANSAAGELLGSPLRELIGRNAQSLDPQILSPEVFQRLLRMRTPEHLNVHLANRIGRQWDMELYCSVLPDASGLPVGVVCMARDVSERKRTHVALEESTRYAESIIDTVRESLVVLDINLKIRSVNRAFCQTFQTTPQEAHQRAIYEIGPGQWSNLSMLRGMFNLLPTDQTFQDIELDYEFPGGTKTFLLSARRLVRRDRNSELILLAMEEVTEQKRAQALLRAAIQELEATQEALNLNRRRPDSQAA